MKPKIAALFVAVGNECPELTAVDVIVKCH